MNRREFLKRAGAAIAAAAVPTIAVAAARDDSLGQTWDVGQDSGVLRFGRLDNVTFIESTPDGLVPDNKWDAFDPWYDHGNGLSITAMPTDQITKVLTEQLYADMVKWIPPDYRWRVEIYGPIAVDYGRSAQIAWRYTAPRKPRVVHHG